MRKSRLYIRELLPFIFSLLILAALIIPLVNLNAQTPSPEASPSPPASPPSEPLINTYIPPVMYATPPAGTPYPPTWSGETGTPPPSPSGPGSIPPEVTQYAKDWPLANHDYSNTRATQDSAINSGNVNQLNLAWSVPLNGQQLSTTPIIMGDTIYLEDRTYNTFALDFKTGQIKWQTNYDNPEWQGPNGVAVAYGKVFTNKDLYTQAALDMNTGKEIWTTKLSNFKWVYSNIQPIPYDNMLITTVTGHVANPVGSLNGVFYALDQSTGVIKWALSGVDSPETWGHPELHSGGGAWQPPGIDTNTGVLYWGTKNPATILGPNGPYSGTAEFPNGSSRPGPNLYTNCMIALDPQNGKMLWYNSAFPHDLYDHDFMNPPILATANINGTQTEIVIGSGKGGIVFAYDRKTGKQLWKTPVGEHKNDDLTELPDTGAEVLPGLLGGIETMPAYADGLIFVPYVDLPSVYTSTGQLSTAPFQSGSGGLAAIDINNGNIVWDNKLNSMNFGAATVSNDVVFTATYEGTIYAFETKTGRQLWTYRTTAGINGWPAIVGDTIIWPCGAIGIPQVIALRLGASPAATPSPTAPPATGEIPPPASLPEPSSSVTLPSPSPSAVPPGSTPPQASPAPTSSPSGSAVPPTTGVPLIKITSPQDGANLINGDITVTVEVSNFNLVDKIGQPNVSGEGHLIYYLDMVPPEAPGAAATTAPNTFITSPSISNVWKNVPGGQHSFTVQLVNNDNTPLSPPVSTGVTVNVESGQNVTIDLIAENITFNLNTITVPAGAQVTINFTNRDSGIPHNLDIFQTGGQYNRGIFTGHSITGVSTITYQFTAPVTSGTYKFVCDFHPLQMFGSFVVTQP